MEKDTGYYDWNQFFDDDEGTTAPKIGDGAPRYIGADDLDRAVVFANIDRVAAESVKPSVLGSFYRGLHDAGLELKTLDESAVILGGQTLMAVGGVFGEDNKLVKWGKKIVQSGARDMDEERAEIERRSFSSFRPELNERYSYKLAGGFSSFGQMLLANYVTGGFAGALGLGAKAAARAGQAAALTFGAASEASSEVQEGIDTYRERTGDTDLSEYAPKEAAKEAVTTGLYTAGATALEGLNLNRLFKLFKGKSKSWVADAVEGAITEGLTETAQGALNAFIDVSDGTIKWDDMPERLKQELVNGSIGLIVGGNVAGAFSLYHRKRGREAMRGYLRGSVPEKDLNRVANAVWDGLQEGATDIIARELVYSEELRNKHGDIYNAMQRAIARAADDSGAFADADEATRAQYIDETARMFADQTLAEANQRGVSIDEVLKASDIAFDGEGIALSFNKDADAQSVSEGVETASPLEQAMFKSPLKNVGEFYDSVVKGEENRPRYFSFTTPSGAEVGLPDYVVRHDINGHNLTNTDLENVFENLENIERYGVSERPTEFAEKSLLLKVNTPQGPYGVAVALGKNQNFISTVFKSTGEKGVDAWIESGASLRPANNPPAALGETPISVVPQGKPLKDIISEARSEINTAAEGERSAETDALEISEDVARQEEEITAEAFKEPSKETETESAAETAAPTGKKKSESIRDFGEKIAGAKKDLWASWKERMRETPAEGSDFTVSEVFPMPNWEAAIANGTDTDTLAFIKLIRDMTLSVPKKRRDWRDLVLTFRDYARQVLDGNITAEEAASALPENSLNLPKRYQLYKDLGYPAFLKAKDYDVVEYLFAFDPWIIRKNRRIAGRYPTREDAVNALRDMLTSTEKQRRETKFTVYKVSDTGEIIIGKKLGRGRYLDLKGGFKSGEEAFKYIDEHRQELEAELKRAKEVIEERGEANKERTGKQWREDVDVSPEEFLKTFGFRGVQFGNYVGQDLRSKNLNEAYDALLDLSDVLEIPSQAVSLDGTLGLAFGARGNSKAMAHYEPMQVVINLTKKRGAGSLAHEWWHALDNYFGAQKTFDREAADKKDLYMTVSGRATAHRAEMKEAFDNVVKTIKESGMYQRALSLDNARENPYWSSETELTARAFEAYVKDKLAEKGTKNDFLVNILNEEDVENPNRYQYPTTDERVKIDEAFDRLFDTMQTEPTEKGYRLYQNAYDEYVRDFEFDDTGFMKEIAALSQKPNKKKTAELRQKYGTDSRTVREAYEYIEGLRKRRALRNAPQSSETAADRLNARREQEAKDRAYREAHPEFFPKELSEEEMQKGREEAAVSLSEDVFGAMSKSERETYERDYASANLRERRAMTASANLEYFTKAVLPEMQKAQEVKNVKKSDISGSLYIDGARVSDHSLPGKYNGDDGVILSGVMSAEDMREAVLQEIDDAAARNNDRKQREVFYQTSDLVERADGPKIAEDSETVDVVEIPENAVPKFEKTADLRNWLIGRFNEIGSVTIESTGANVDFNVTAARRTLKNARNERNNIAYPEIEKVVSGAKYSGFREADGRHQDKVRGQDVYHSAVVVDGKPYSVEFYVDVPLSEGKDNFAGNKISKIEMEPQRHGFNPVANGTNVPQGSIHTISMGVLRGKVKPARLRDGGLSQRKTVRSDVIKGSFDPSERIIRITKNADYSTLPHEFAHYWLTMQKSWYDSGAASEAYQERMRIAFDWLGVKPWKNIGVRAQEKFARGYEQYLLNGDLPESPLNPAFKEYDRWLKEVYNGANKPQKQPLTEDMVRFFNSMTTGVLPPPVKTPVNTPPDEELEKPEGNNSVLLTSSRLEKPAVAAETDSGTASPVRDGAEETVRVYDAAEEADAETGRVSRAAERRQKIAALQGKIAEDETQNVYYTPITLEEQAGRAYALMQNEGAEAVRDMIDGKRDLPEGVMRVPAMIAYEEEMLRQGNLTEYARVLKKHTLEQTRRGQEIVSERLAGRDISDLRYWFKRVVSNKKAAAAEKFKTLFQKEGGEKGYNDYLRRIADRTANAVIRAENAYDRRSILNEALREAEVATGKKADLTNVDVAGDGARLYDRIYDAVAQEIDALFEVTLSAEETKRLFEASVRLKTAYADYMKANPNKNPPVEVMRLLKEMTDTANAMSPSNALALGVNVWGRAAMLASVKTPILNIESNLVGAVTEAMIRRARLRSWDKAVDPEAIEAYKAYDAAVYDASGITMSTVRAESILEPSLFGAVKGERVLTTQGEGRVRAASRFAENVIFKWSLGKPDAVFKRHAFVDNADLEATKIAKAEGYEGDALKKRATEIFNDAVLFNPQTPEGQGVRERSVAAAEIVTYTNDGLISRFSLKARELLNDATGNARIGDIVMPFVKTPANVAALGLEYSAGLGRLVLDGRHILRDVRNRTWSAESQAAVNAAVRNGFGAVLALLLVAGIEPDDYISSFDLASPKERDLARMKNAPFNSVKIGGAYVSLDYFGPLAAPMAAVLEAQKREGFWAVAYEYVKTALVQASGNIPAIEGLSSAVGAGTELARMDADTLVKEVSNDAVDAALSRLVPAIVGDVAKVIDDYERDMSGASVIDKVAEKLPFVREALPVRFNTATGRPKESSVLQLLFGSRLKEAEQSEFVAEIDRLHEGGNSPVLSDVTKTRAFSGLTAEEKAKIRAEFNGGFTSRSGRFVKGYPEQAAAMMRSVSYRRASDIRKKQALDKLRRKIVDEIKRKRGIARGSK